MKLLNVQSAWFGYGALYSMVIMLWLVIIYANTPTLLDKSIAVLGCSEHGGIEKIYADSGMIICADNHRVKNSPEGVEVLVVREYLKEFTYFGITIIDYDKLNLKEVLDVK